MNVVILDTGCANLSSVKWAIERLGYTPAVSRDPDVVLRADKLFLPGVGTARAAMDQLQERELIELVKACTQPVLGICLGMQLLGRGSDENGGVSTLGIVDEPVSLMDTRVYRCHIWAGTGSPRRPAITCSATFRTAATSTLCTATPCR